MSSPISKEYIQQKLLEEFKEIAKTTTDERTKKVCNSIDTILFKGLENGCCLLYRKKRFSTRLITKEELCGLKNDDAETFRKVAERIASIHQTWEFNLRSDNMLKVLSCFAFEKPDDCRPFLNKYGVVSVVQSPDVPSKTCISSRLSDPGEALLKGDIMKEDLKKKHAAIMRLVGQIFEMKNSEATENLKTILDEDNQFLRKLLADQNSQASKIFLGSRTKETMKVLSSTL